MIRALVDSAFAISESRTFFVSSLSPSRFRIFLYRSGSGLVI